MVAASRIAGFGLIKLCLDATNNLLNTFTGPRQPRKKVALIIGINYEGNTNWKLSGPQTDVKSVRELLIEKFYFSKENIVVLSDEEDTPVNFLPTQYNIMREVNKFVSKTDSNVDYFFVYSGHSNQRKEVVQEGKHPVEEDGKEEYIIPSDALADKLDFEEAVKHENIISDKTLNECLVKRLGKGSQLVALFDSCHSGTLLNLKHHRCNRVGDFLSLIQDTSRRVLVEPLYARFSRQVAPVDSTRYPRALCKTGTQLSTVSRDSTVGTWRRRRCTGFCPRSPSGGKAQVVCFSACKDSQLTVESPAGGTMINSIVNLLRENPRPSYREVMLATRYGANKLKKDMREDLKKSLKKKPCNKPVPLHFKCLTDEERALKGLTRARFDPQLSSLRPLNTKCLLRICDLAGDITHLPRN